MTSEQLTTIFTRHFNTEPALIVKAPGRINLIGEHTDYNDGFVLPAAIDKYMYCAIGPDKANKCEIYAVDLEEDIVIYLNDKLTPVAPGHWGNYIAGVIAGIQQQGYRLQGFRAVFASTIPLGGGLSSSAALAVAFGAAINQLQGFSLSPVTIARIGQQAEHAFAGVACGIMDQFAVTLGREDNFFKLDCRSLAYTYVPANLGDYQLLLFDSKVKHTLAASAYNQRRQECDAGVRALQQYFPEVKALRDANMAMLSVIKPAVGQRIFNRCRYVIEENNRVVSTIAALQQNNLPAVGNLLYASHQGLTGLYEVSCPELDYLVALTNDREEVLGARMMGGGFGGCTINLVKAGRIRQLTTFMQQAYLEHLGLELSAYPVNLANGVTIIV